MEKIGKYIPRDGDIITVVGKPLLHMHHFPEGTHIDTMCCDVFGTPKEMAVLVDENGNRVMGVVKGKV